MNSIKKYNVKDFYKPKTIFTTKNAYDKRCGALGVKIGMTRIKDGEKMLPITLISLNGCKVISHINEADRGYNAILIGLAGKKNINKPQLEMFKKINQEPVGTLKEYRVNSLEGAPEVGSDFAANYFEIGQKIDISGISIGKGFAGGMKRWNFGGLRASHGVSVSHRSLGSTGNRTEPGRVFPGKKMPGRLGGEQTTVQNLKVVYINEEHNVIGVLGAVPGNAGKTVSIRDAIKA